MPPLAESVISGTKEIAATNTAEKVRTTSESVMGVSVKATKGNAAVVHIGPSTVGATSYALEGGESLQFEVLDLSRIFVFGKEKDKVEFFGLVP